MRVSEYLSFRAELKGVPRKKRPSAILSALEKARVRDVANHRIGTLSKGYRQRVGLADALVADPPILILDEPTAGMDPNQIRDVRAVVKALGETHTVLLSTHILSEVEATCSRVVVIAKGKLVAEGAVKDLAKLGKRPGTLVTVTGAAALATKALESIDGIGAIEEVAREGGDAVSTLRFDGAAPLVEKAVSALVHAGLGVREVRPAGGALEDLFAELTRGDDRDGEEEAAG
jgi:ABC-2 type transport system ATP-binding protein